VGVEALRRDLAACRLVVLDTCVLSYHLSQHPRYTPLTDVVLAAVEAGDVAGLITTVTLAEVLVVPAKAGDRRAMQDYELYLMRFPHLEIVSMDAALARETALVRAEAGLRMPDAVQMAAARLYGADAAVTNDHRWEGRLASPKVLVLDRYLLS
jgi:predicted nucleic acid-binding protein